MRVLLLGAGGMLAQDLAATAPAGIELVMLRRTETDVTVEPAVAAAFRDVQPGLAINCAAYTGVDRAEIERDEAFAVNGRGPGVIGRAAANSGTAVIHYSTDYVFDGRGSTPYSEEDVPAPLGVYGASKLLGERALEESGARYLVIRTQWLFGVAGYSFPRTMWERATRRQATKAVNDQVGRPTYTVDLARATWRLAMMMVEGRSGGPAGVLNVTNERVATWYDLAKRVFDAAGASDLVRPCATSEYRTTAARPAFSVLDTSRFRRITGAPLPPWENAVERFLGQLRSAA